MAYELEPFGIDVILMEPGPYRTSIWHSSPRIKPPDSAYFAWIGQAFQAGDWHGARMARDPKEVGVAIARVLGHVDPAFDTCGPLRSPKSFSAWEDANPAHAKGRAALLGAPPLFKVAKSCSR